MSEPTNDSQAQGFIALLWQHITDAIERGVFPHHIRHEPGGSDQIELDLDELANCDLGDKVTGNVPVWNSTSGKWEAGTGGTGSGSHAVHFSTALPMLAAVPGPTNISGAAMTIIATRFESDGEASGSLSLGPSFAFAAGGGVDRTNDLSIAWADDVTIEIAIDTSGNDATWLTVDLAVQ